MAYNVNKRTKEQQRLQRRRDKDAKREERKRQKAERPAGPEDEDPDIAGIVPGPQPEQELS